MYAESSGGNTLLVDQEHCAQTTNNIDARQNMQCSSNSMYIYLFYEILPKKVLHH